jgi:hypothetical protein
MFLCTYNMVERLQIRVFSKYFLLIDVVFFFRFIRILDTCVDIVNAK